MNKLWKGFKKKFPIVEAAGGLVKRTDNKLLFIFRNNKWDLPKGGVEKKELIIDAAKREVTEETGVADIIVEKKISETYHIFKKGKIFRLKKTYWFKCQQHTWVKLTLKLRKVLKRQNGYRIKILKIF